MQYGSEVDFKSLRAPQANACHRCLCALGPCGCESDVRATAVCAMSMGSSGFLLSNVAAVLFQRCALQTAIKGGGCCSYYVPTYVSFSCSSIPAPLFGVGASGVAFLAAGHTWVGHILVGSCRQFSQKYTLFIFIHSMNQSSKFGGAAESRGLPLTKANASGF